MHFHYTPYMWVLLASATVGVLVAAYAWQHRGVPGAIPFAAVALMAAVWALANALEMSAADLAGKLFWANLQYLCYVGEPVGWLVMALEHTGVARRLRRRHLAALVVVPAITLVLVWTNPLHGLMRRNVFLDTAGPFSVIGKTYGPWFWVHTAYSYLLVAATVILLVQALVHPAHLYRGQTLALLIGLLLPFVPNLLYIAHRSPFPRFDVTPAVFPLAGLAVAFGLFRYRLFDVVPVARAAVMENLADAVLVLDGQGRVVDLNPAAQRLLGAPGWRALGQPAAEALRNWPSLASLVGDPHLQRAEVAVNLGGESRFFELRGSQLVRGEGEARGRLILLHDVTEPRRAQNQLLAQQRALAVLEERERLARELHDSLGQVLAYVDLQAQVVGELYAGGQGPAGEAALARLAQVARDAYADVREYIHGVRVTVEREGGFHAALQRYLERLERSYGLHVDLGGLEALGPGALDPVAEVQLLRIIQEALANVRKHSGATGARITLGVVGGLARVVIEDEGCGFDAASQAAVPSQHYGLRSMRERAEEAGGSLEVHSAPGRGTRVVVQVPLAKAGSGQGP